jgi:hypothetical protein
VFLCAQTALWGVATRAAGYFTARCMLSPYTNMLLFLLPSVAAECGMEPKSGRCKNMFLKSKKGELFVFSCQAQAVRWPKPAIVQLQDPQKALPWPPLGRDSDEVAAPQTRDMKTISKKLGAAECRFASDEFLSGVLNVVKGSVREHLPIPIPIPIPLPSPPSSSCL